jgi:hypothetical protein
MLVMTDSPPVTKTDASNEILIAALAAGQPYVTAGAGAGVSERTVRRRMAEPAFAAEVARRRSQHVACVTGKLLATAEEAVRVIADCLQSDKASDRLRAAELMLTFVRRFHADSDIDARLTALEAAAGSPVTGHVD